MVTIMVMFRIRVWVGFRASAMDRAGIGLEVGLWLGLGVKNRFRTEVMGRVRRRYRVRVLVRVRNRVTLRAKAWFRG